MRIALLNSLFPDLGIGGSEMSTFFLAQGLQNLGHTVQVFSENAAPEDDFGVYKNISVLRFGAPAGYGPNIYAEPRLQRMHATSSAKPDKLSARATQKLLEFQPNVIHTNVVNDAMGFWKLAENFGIPVVHTLRSYGLLCHRRMLRGEVPCARQCASCLTTPRHESRKKSNMISGVVAISRHVMDVHCSAGWFADVQHKIVIGNSYEPNPSEASHEAQEPAYDFGYIGRIHETKGVDIFLDAVSLLRARSDKKIRVLIAGDGNAQYAHALKTRYETAEIHFAGFMQQDEFFSRIKYCVVPSVWFEPFGRVFIESLHHGVPVVGSKRGGGAEVLDTSTGWLFDPGEVEEFASKLSEALNVTPETYNIMSNACLAKAESYSVNAIAQAYTDFYLKCVGGVK